MLPFARKATKPASVGRPSNLEFGARRIDRLVVVDIGLLRSL
jgi:hypothetical protein